MDIRSHIGSNLADHSCGKSTILSLGPNGLCPAIAQLHISHFYNASVNWHEYARCLDACPCWLSVSESPRSREDVLEEETDAELFSSTTDFLFSVHLCVHIDGYLVECQ